jgi:hypothetical protein
MKFFKDEVFELTIQNIGKLAKNLEESIGIQISIPERYSKLPLFCLESPKSYYVGTRQIYRSGLWTVTESSGPIASDKDITQVKKELEVSRVISSGEQKRQLLEEQEQRYGIKSLR